jgi:hypothetical protein
MMKMKRAFASLALLWVLPLAACRPSTTDVRVASAAEPTPGITVIGTGEARAEPDVARANIGVEVRSSTVGAAVSEANQRMNAVVAALKGLGIPDKDLQTHDFSIHYERYAQPEPPPPPPQPRPGTPTKPGTPSIEMAPRPVPEGEYRVTNMLTVTIRDFTKIGQTFDVALKAGANNVWGLVFEMDDPTPLRAQARAKAVADAQQRAQQLAKLSGIGIGGVRAIEEMGSMDRPMSYGYEMRAQAADGVPIERGQVAMNIQVRVVFDLADPKR